MTPSRPTREAAGQQPAPPGQLVGEADLGIEPVWLITSATRATLGEWPEVFGPGQTVAPAGAGQIPVRAVVVVDLTALRGHRTAGLDAALVGRALVTTSSDSMGFPNCPNLLRSAGEPAGQRSWWNQFLGGANRVLVGRGGWKFFGPARRHPAPPRPARRNRVG